MAQLDTRIAQLRDEILTRGLNRRDVLKRSLALGLSAPVIAALLAACGDDDDDDDDVVPTATEAPAADDDEDEEEEEPEETEEDEEPEATEEPEEDEEDEEPEEDDDDVADVKGGSGRLNLLMWQAATILNPHLAQGGKDFTACSIFLYPLADFDNDGNLVPKLATEIPSFENGLLAEDGTSVTWKIHEGVLWHDGTPLTARDVVFTWEYATDPDAGLVRPVHHDAESDHSRAHPPRLDGREGERRAVQSRSDRMRPVQGDRLPPRRHRHL